jgi:regulator of sigma E protease
LTVLLNAVVPGIVLLGLVIFVHELGHFAMAKWRGVKVLRFSLGFGPALFSVRRGETEYRLSWIPLGGYVHMAGDAPGGS